MNEYHIRGTKKLVEVNKGYNIFDLEVGIQALKLSSSSQGACSYNAIKIN